MYSSLCGGALQIEAVCLQYTLRILFGICVAQKEEEAFFGDILLYDVHIHFR